MIEAGQYIELTLRIVFVTGFQCDRLHGELDLVVVLLLDKLDDAILTRAKAFSHVVQLVDLFCF